MSITGRSSLSIKKQDIQGQKLGATGFRKITFAHKAVAGETSITLSSLVTPPELLSAGFTQPSPALLASANLKFFRNNLTLISSARGVLQDYLSYTVNNSTLIKFTDDFGTTLDGEIFIGVIDAVPRNDLVGIDSTSILASGTLSATQVQFNVGSAFKVNANPSTQIGEIAVYLDGVIQFRNSSNAAADPLADGNYQEIDNGSGYGTLIEFNDVDPISDRAVMIVGTGISVIRPNGSLVQELELLAGQIDAMVPTLAALAGVSESTFQSAPTNSDLKAFGDRVLDLEQTKANIDEDNVWTAPQSLVGVTDGSSAAAGEVGEYITSPTTSPNITAAGFSNLETIVLTAGDWDVFAMGNARISSAVGMTGLTFAISTNSESLTGTTFGSGDYIEIDMTIGNTTRWKSQMLYRRLSLTLTTTVYLVRNVSTYSSGTGNSSGRIWARRVR